MKGPTSATIFLAVMFLTCLFLIFLPAIFLSQASISGLNPCPYVFIRGSFVSHRKRAVPGPFENRKPTVMDFGQLRRFTPMNGYERLLFAAAV